MIHFSPSHYASGNRHANADIKKVSQKYGVAATKNYAHDRHEKCDRLMNKVKKNSNYYSFLVGQAGAFGYYAANGYRQFVDPKKGH